MHNDTSQAENQTEKKSSPLANKDLFKKSFNFIVYEDKLPLPPVISSFRNDWYNHEFYLTDTSLTEDVGFEFFIFGGKLYSKQDKITQIDYTGEVSFGDYFILEDTDYRVIFKVLLFKGEVKEVLLVSCEEFDPEKRKNLTSHITDSVSKKIKRESSWWYKCLYLPHKFLVTLCYDFIYLILKLIHTAAIILLKILTPW